MKTLTLPFALTLSAFFLFLNISVKGQPSGASDRMSAWAKSKAYIDTAWDYLHTEPQKTRLYAEKLMQLAQKENLIRPQSSAHTLLGLYYETTGNYPEAINQYHQAINVLLPHDSLRQFLNSAYANISIVYHYSENYEKSIEYRRKALKLEQKYGNLEDLLGSYIALGNFYKKMDQHDSALHYFRMATREKNRHPRAAALAYGNMGDLYVKEKHWDSALFAFEYHAAYADTSPSADLYDKLAAKYDLANYFLLQNQYDEALPPLREAYEIADSLNNMEYLADLMNLYSQYHEGTGNVPLAFDYYKRGRSLRDSITGADVKARIAELEAQYRHEKQSNEISELRSEAEIKDLLIVKQQAQRNYLLLLTVFIAVILALILFFYFSLKKRSKKLREQNELIKESNREMEELIRESHHRIKNNLQVVSSLLRMQSQNAQTPQAKTSLLEAYNRIKTIAMMHQRLQGSHTFRTVDMHEFINRLTTSIRESLTDAGSSIEIVADVEHIEMETDRSIAVGLVVNEAITNSLKYAFVNGKGQIHVAMHHVDDSKISLDVSDNGKGTPDNFSLEKDSHLGFRIIKSLTTKLHGDLKIKEKEGFSINITFPTSIIH